MRAAKASSIQPARETVSSSQNGIVPKGSQAQATTAKSSQGRFGKSAKISAIGSVTEIVPNKALLSFFK
jgi:hypothetical protein